MKISGNWNKAFCLVLVMIVTSISLPTQAQFVKEYVRSFNLRQSDTILIDLQIPYELVDWDRSIVRTFSQIESFSLPDELLRKLSRKGRYSVVGERKNNILRVYMPDVHHVISVQGVQLTDEVIAQIYVPKDFPVKVICNSQTPEEQLKDLWLQQEVLTRRLNYPIRKTINTDFYADVRFQEGIITQAERIKGTKRFLKLEVLSNGKSYPVISRIGKLYEPSELLEKAVVFVVHDFAPTLRRKHNTGMVLVSEDSNGALNLLKREEIPDFLILE